jgi:phosphatidylserine/phosphatidylglycerophosphate/cardiolipin synthase-like enzyme
MNPEIIREIQQVAMMPADLVDGVAAALRSLEHRSSPPAVDAMIASVPPRWREPVRALLATAGSAQPQIQYDALALAIQAACATRVAVASQQEVELVWSGPPVVQSSFRRTDRAWIDVIDGASSSLWLASYSLGSVDRVQESLMAAIRRGVVVRLLFERAADSDGALRYDNIALFHASVAAGATLYGWRPDRREISPGGSQALMHAKAVVADSQTMFVTSANLSAAALERNLEVGVIVRGGPQPQWLHQRFETLLANGIIEQRSI